MSKQAAYLHKDPSRISSGLRRSAITIRLHTDVKHE